MQPMKPIRLPLALAKSPALYQLNIGAWSKNGATHTIQVRDCSALQPARQCVTAVRQGSARRLYRPLRLAVPVGARVPVVWKKVEMIRLLLAYKIPPAAVAVLDAPIRRKVSDAPSCGNPSIRA